MTVGNLIPVLTTFIVVALAELGDKSQLAVITLSAKNKPKSVFLGSLLVFALIDGISAIVGGSIGAYFPVLWINIACGIIFLAIGVYTIFSPGDLTVIIKERSNVLLTSFFLVGALELGDKTQLAVIALAAEYSAPIQVFAGMILAFSLLTGVGVVFGALLCRYISRRYIKIGSGLVFLAFGIIYLFQATPKLV